MTDPSTATGTSALGAIHPASSSRPQVHPPPVFLPVPGDPPIPWLHWQRSFETYLLAAGLDDLPPERKKALLIHSLGAEGQRLFYSFATEAAISGTDTHCYANTLDALNAFFVPKVNVVAARYRFRQRAQHAAESTETYITALRAKCNFGTMYDEMLRDQLLEKTASTRIPERLPMEPSLTLETAVELSRQIEEASREAQHMSGGSLPSVQAITHTKRCKHQQQLCSKSQQRHTGHSTTACYRCGSADHKTDFSRCPARKSICRSSSKVGHFAKECRSKPKPTKSIRTVESNQDIARVSKVHVANANPKCHRSRQCFPNFSG